ncbi:hypothetical protein KVT40_007414 [Elsinoe batatas]|uniref:UBX domain-containing protein n=1 Tax=Elsinoe batatas TaxID=2601811 RepID=A0A8K0PD87_9PEZI|nr:hypothetical protein KVT40_007414 [Elsinoe batatas]
MFFQGDLQSGIALAVQERNLVACLVVKENDLESDKWEKEWFGSESQAPNTNPTFGDLLSAKAVILRLFAGSEEVEFLSAFCTVERVPKLVIIKHELSYLFTEMMLTHYSNGTVIVDVESGASEEELSRVTPKLLEILGDSGHHPASPETKPEPVESTTTPEATSTALLLLQRIYQPAISEEEKQEAEKEARKVISRARREQAERAAAGEDVTPAWKRTWVEHQRVRQREAVAEREAIRRTIAEDKERRQARRKASSTATIPNTTPKMAASSASLPAGTSCSLNIRLFDGTSIRSKFSAEATLTTSVRTFVTENSSTDIPYNFRIMDLPKPARTIEISEENQSLRELGLCPNATLVLVPVRDFTDAYASQGAAGVVNKGLNLGYNVAYGAFSIVGGIFSKVTGYQVNEEAAEGPYIAGTGDNPNHLVSQKDGKRPEQLATPTPGIKITTLKDQKGKQPAEEFYNGNTTNVEPRPDDQK